MVCIFYKALSLSWDYCMINFIKNQIKKASKMLYYFIYKQLRCLLLLFGGLDMSINEALENNFFYCYHLIPIFFQSTILFWDWSWKNHTHILQFFAIAKNIIRIPLDYIINRILSIEKDDHWYLFIVLISHVF